MGNWYEAYPGHYFLSTGEGMLRVAVDARGPNMLHPVAYIDSGDYRNLYYEVCSSVEEAQGKAEAQYRYLLEQELKLLAPRGQ